MTDQRIVPCCNCASEGRIYRGQYDDERDCGECPACEGTGGEIIETEPVTLDDLGRKAFCTDCGAQIDPMLFPCLERTCPQRVAKGASAHRQEPP